MTRLFRVPLALSHPSPPGPEFQEASFDGEFRPFQFSGNSPSDFGMKYFAIELVEINGSGTIFPKLLMP